MDLTPTGVPFIDDLRARLMQRNGVVTLFDMEEHLVECSRDQPLSRHIQKRLEDGSGSSSNMEARKERDLLFKEVMEGEPLELVKDKFGNYVVQKMFDFGSLQQR